MTRYAMACFILLFITGGCRKEATEDFMEKTMMQSVTTNEASPRNLEIRFYKENGSQLDWRCAGLGFAPVSEAFCRWLIDECANDLQRGDNPAIHIYFPCDFPCSARRAVISLAFSVGRTLYTHNEHPLGLWLDARVGIIHADRNSMPAYHSISEYVEAVTRRMMDENELVDCVMTSDSKGNDLDTYIIRCNLTTGNLMEALFRHAAGSYRICLIWEFSDRSYAEDFYANQFERVGAKVRSLRKTSACPPSQPDEKGAWEGEVIVNCCNKGKGEN